MQAGPSASAMAFGGSGPPGRLSESNSYDGATWTASATLTTARSAGARSVDGTTSACLIAGGTMPGNTNATEEFSVADAAVTFTAS